MAIKDWFFGKKTVTVQDDKKDTRIRLTLAEETVTVQGHDENGKPFSVEVPESKWREWKGAGKLSKIEAVEVHILDPMRDYYVTNWEIGQDVDAADVEQWRDSGTGVIYVMTVYKKGEPVRYFCTKEKWEEVKVTMDM